MVAWTHFLHYVSADGLMFSFFTYTPEHPTEDSVHQFSSVAQSCPTLCDLKELFSVHGGIEQILFPNEFIEVEFSRTSFSNFRGEGEKAGYTAMEGVIRASLAPFSGARGPRL